jgi:hypothetical protein
MRPAGRIAVAPWQHRGDPGGAGYTRRCGDTLPNEPTTNEPTATLFSPVLEVMRGVVQRASGAIFEHAWAKPELRGMGAADSAYGESHACVRSADSFVRGSPDGRTS